MNEGTEWLENPNPDGSGLFFLPLRDGIYGTVITYDNAEDRAAAVNKCKAFTEAVMRWDFLRGQAFAKGVYSCDNLMQVLKKVGQV